MTDKPVSVSNKVAEKTPEDPAKYGVVNLNGKITLADPTTLGNIMGVAPAEAYDAYDATKDCDDAQSPDMCLNDKDNAVVELAPTDDTPKAPENMASQITGPGADPNPGGKPHPKDSSSNSGNGGTDASSGGAKPGPGNVGGDGDTLTVPKPGPGIVDNGGGSGSGGSGSGGGDGSGGDLTDINN